MISSLLITLLLSLQAGEQDPANVPGSTEQNPATFRIGTWIPRLGGTIQDGGGAIDLETNIKLDNRETVPLFEFSLRPVEDITFSLSVFDFSTSGSGLFKGNKTFGPMAMAAGDSWVASTSMQSVGFEAAWDVLTPFKTSEHATLSFAPVVGLRWYGVDADLRNVTSATTVSHSNGWVAVQAGLQMQFEWDTQEFTDSIDSLAIDSQLLVGTMFGGDGGSMWSLRAGLTARFSPTIAGYFGYRLQELDAEEGSYVFSAGLQGLYMGGELRF